MTRILEAELAVPAQCELAEGPVWDVRRGLLWWVDILAGRVHTVDHDGQRLTRVPGFSFDRTAIRFNNGKPHPWGNFMAGTMAWDETGDPPGSLYRLSPDGIVTELFGGVGLSNGLDWTDDRRRFYYADSNSGRVDLFDTDPATGALSARRPRRRHLRLHPRRNRPPPVPIRGMTAERQSNRR